MVLVLRLPDGNPSFDAGSMAYAALDLETAAQPFHTFSHIDQAIVPIGRRTLGGGLETAAIVLYEHTHLPPFETEAKPRGMGISVLNGVVEGFSRHHQDLVLRLLIQTRRPP
jgi:hypothetical protein